ncbi:YIP1 family protein [Halobacteria archaeon HArc-gm2]|nr:YIP1 family protein [Halobacteria archaeon HArc-gm2]
MFENVGTLLTNPGRFFDGRADGPSLKEPAIIVLVTALISTLGIAGIFLAFTEAVPSDLQIFIFIVVLFVAAFSFAGPFIGWLLYALAFQVITYFFDGEGEFRDTFALTGWGYTPRIIYGVISVAITIYVTQAAQPPADPSGFTAYSTRISNHPLNQLSIGLSVLFTLWSAYIWIPAVQRARNVTRNQAIIAVAIPVLFGILIAVGSFFINAASQGGV